MKNQKPAKLGLSPTGHTVAYTIGKSTAVAREFRDSRSESLGHSGIAIGLAFYKPATGKAIQGNKIMQTALTKRSQGQILTSVTVTQEGAWALYCALHEMFYEDPHDEIAD